MYQDVVREIAMSLGQALKSWSERRVPVTHENPAVPAPSSFWVQKKNNLDIIRFFLASSVIFGHSYQILLPEAQQILADPTRRFTKGQMYIGDFAVDMFFVISGYLILMSWQRHPMVVDFLRNRILRIMPGYLVAFALSVFLFGVLGADSTASYFASGAVYRATEWVRALALIHPPLALDTYLSSHLDKNLNAPMWTLTHEFECYLGLMALGVIGAFRWRPVIPALVLVGFVQFMRAPVWESHYRLPLAFLVGMLYYQERDLIQLKAIPALILPIIWVVAVQLGYALPVSALTCGYTFLYLGLAAKPIKWIKPDFSYGMYLYGFPVQQVIAHWNMGWIQPWELTSLAVIGALAFAAMSWYLVESRFLKLKAKTGMREASV